MPSNINPFNINGNYPVAGQDNDSQGFRNNFTNIRNNLSFAKTEIQELQDKAVVRSPLTGATQVDNNFNGNEIYNVVLKEASEKWFSIPNASGLVSLDFKQAQFFYIELNGSITVELLNMPTDKHSKIRLHVYSSNPAYSMVIPTAPSGAQIGYGRESIQNINYDSTAVSFPVVGDKFYEIGSTLRTANGRFYIVELQKVLNRKEYVAITEGGTLSVGDDVETMIMNATSAISTFTVEFPRYPADGQKFNLALTGNAITTLTMQSGVGVTHTILAPIATISANGYASWIFHRTGATTGIWVRLN